VSRETSWSQSTSLVNGREGGLKVARAVIYSKSGLVLGRSSIDL
jgi:hypothetical protein